MSDDKGEPSTSKKIDGEGNKNENSNQSGVEERLTTSNDYQAPDIAALNADAFNSLVAYVQDDLSSVADDYKLLENMNKVATGKYSEMKNVASGVHMEMLKINDKYRSLVPYLEQIDQIEESVAALEEVAYRLDAYSKRLETKFKQTEKR